MAGFKGERLNINLTEIKSIEKKKYLFKVNNENVTAVSMGIDLAFEEVFVNGKDVSKYRRKLFLGLLFMVKIHISL